MPVKIAKTDLRYLMPNPRIQQHQRRLRPLASQSTVTKSYRCTAVSAYKLTSQTTDHPFHSPFPETMAVVLETPTPKHKTCFPLHHYPGEALPPAPSSLKSWTGRSRAGDPLPNEQDGSRCTLR